jgi:VWFA-related protein
LASFWLCFVLLASSLAQQASDAPNVEASTSTTDAPVAILKARTDLVLVPVVVRDKHGKHLAGLSKDAFQLEENGKVQDISLFEEVQAPASGLSSPVIDRGYSNLPFDNAQQLRLTIVVLDLLNTTLLQRADGKDQVARFLSKGLARNQPVSLLCLTTKGVQLVQPFSTDSALLLKALKKLPLGGETIVGRRNASEGTLKQLREIAQAYVGIPGRKTMILAAGNIPELVPEHGVFESSVLASDIQDMWKSLIDANISVYPVQLLQASVDQTRGGRFVARATYTSLHEFALATGGNLCLEDNGFMECLADAVEDSRSYYMLGFSVRPDDRKPGWRDLKVKVSAEHVSVRARNGFYFGAPEPSNPKSVREAEINALAHPSPTAPCPCTCECSLLHPQLTPRLLPARSRSGS